MLVAEAFVVLFFHSYSFFNVFGICLLSRDFSFYTHSPPDFLLLKLMLLPAWLEGFILRNPRFNDISCSLLENCHKMKFLLR